LDGLRYNIFQSIYAYNYKTEYLLATSSYNTVDPDFEGAYHGYFSAAEPNNFVRGVSLIRVDPQNEVSADATRWIYSTEAIAEELKTNPDTGISRDVGGQLIDGNGFCLSIDQFQNFENAEGGVETRLQYGECLAEITADTFTSGEFTQLWTAE